MKTFFSLLLLLSFSSTVRSQEFAPVGAKWFYSQWSYINANFESYSTIEAVKDTIVANQDCRKMLMTFNQYSGQMQKTVFMFGENRKIFYYSTDSLRFLQLYDFNKQAGDSFQVEGYYSAQFQTNLVAYVDSVDSVQVNSVMLKKIFTHANDGLGNDLFGWSIEKIGNTAWMFPFGDGFETMPLRCYQDLSLGLYESGVAPACDYVTAVNAVNVNQSFSVFPNPAYDFLSVNILERNFQKPFSISIRNLPGKLLFSKTFSAGENLIDVSKLAPGIYFLTMKSGEGNVVQKFEKQ